MEAPAIMMEFPTPRCQRGVQFRIARAPTGNVAASAAPRRKRSIHKHTMTEAAPFTYVPGRNPLNNDVMHHNNAASVSVILGPTTSPTHPAGIWKIAYPQRKLLKI